MSNDATLLLAIIGAVLLVFTVLRLRTFFKRVERAEEIYSQKKRSEVKLGQVSEVLAPILHDFPVDVHKSGTSTVFLGKPLDYIHFDPEHGVTFIEVKSGDARLSKNQRLLKQLIEEKKVFWAEYRVRGRVDEPDI